MQKLDAFLLVDPGWKRARRLRTQGLDPFQHGPPVDDGGAYIGQHARQLGFHGRSVGIFDDAVALHQDQRFNA